MQGEVKALGNVHADNLRLKTPQLQFMQQVEQGFRLRGVGAGRQGAGRLLPPDGQAVDVHQAAAILQFTRLLQDDAVLRQHITDAQVRKEGEGPALPDDEMQFVGDDFFHPLKDQVTVGVDAPADRVLIDGEVK